MNLAACSSLPKTIESGVWYRAVDPAFMTSALSSAHTKATITRFNPGSMLPPARRFPTLYMADSPLVALFEIKALLGSPFAAGMAIPHPRMGHHVLLTINVALQEVVDLTDVAAAQVPLDTNPQELTGDWLGYQWRNARTPVSVPVGITPTQELGLALAQSRVEGFLSVSAPVPNQKTLVVFPDNLKPGSSLTIRDPAGNVVQRLP